MDLYQLSATSTRAFDLGPVARQVYRYPFSPLFGLLNRRLQEGKLAPRSITLFRPLMSVHRQMAHDIQTRGYDIVLAHTDAMTQSPYLLRWLPTGVGVYYCQEPLRVVREPAVLAAHRRKLASSPPPLGALRVLEDRIVLARLSKADRLTVARASHILVNSEYSRGEVLSAYGRDATVCYLGVDPEAFKPSAGDGERLNQVLSVGAPLLAKGNELIIDALATVPGSIRPRLLIVAGSMSGAELLRTRAQAAGVELSFESAISDEALAEHYRRSLATIGASRGEPFGLTALESMACATPVIAIREGGFQETVVDGVTGFLVEPTPASLGSAITRLASDRLMSASLGAQGRQRALEQWTWAQSGNRLDAILRQVVADRQSARASAFR